ncbi:ATP-binding protein, partial [Leucobacter sp. M11]|uniref:ATP-binding protein n=1 Tax=Leucobacter sp. M11 TaxID=2993565 RepID=UPI002D8EDD52|nr:acetyl-/propionyl-CoA carboxylase subunit alpha [Leucobacter sp. M11]
QFDAAVREATAAFGRGECFVERFLDRPRHIEVQVLADAAGTVWTLGTRDCSLQRRNQKLVEEAPAPGLSDGQREELARAARELCLAAGYVGAGTVEFLLGTDGTLSFLEVNTRLQVEHTVTEEIFGVDLVAWQLRIAAGETLPAAAPEARGHALEFRINAEDPARGFLPAPGTVTRFEAPSGPGVRLDTGVGAGSTVPPVFDSLLAKLVVTGQDRAEAIRRARRALAEFAIEGLPTVLPFHRAVLEAADFAGEHPEGHRVHTRWIETVFDAELAVTPFLPAEAEPGMLRAELELDGRLVRIGLPGALLAALGGLCAHTPGTPAAAGPEQPAAEAPGAVSAPITGTVQ